MLPLLLALLPSILWLALYLRQDAHPEPKGLVIKTFIAGMAAAAVAAASEWVLLCSFFVHQNCADSSGITALDPLPSVNIGLEGPLAFFISGFIGIALIEELSKLMAVRLTVLKSHNFDEPVDAMIYLIIAALGFATVENILIMLQSDVAGLPASDLVRLTIFRSLGATFLHTTAAGLTGYFLSRSFFPNEPKKILLTVGLLLAALSHWLYNSFIDTLATQVKAGGTAQTTLTLSLLLAISGIVIFSLLKHLRAVSFRHEFTPLRYH